jgi:hypothetical protein
MFRAQFSRGLARVFALVGAVPLITLSLASALPELTHFIDPCFSWATSGRSIPNRSVFINCRGRQGGTSETRLGTLLRLSAVQGSGLYSAYLALKGSFRSKRRLTLAGAFISTLLTVVLMVGFSGYWLVVLACAACFLLSYLFGLATGNTSVTQ